MKKLSKESSFFKKISKLEVDLKNQIKKRILQPGECILSEHQLSEKYKISRPSVRKVLKKLVQEDLLYKMPGKGTFVRDPEADRKRKAGNIGVIFYLSRESMLSNPFSAGVFEGMEREISEQGCNLMFSSIRAEGVDEISIPKIIREKSVDGAILFSVIEDSYILEVMKEGVPLVLADYSSSMLELDSIVFDNVKGAYEGVKYLLELGHTDIGFFFGQRGGPDRGFTVDPSSWERLEGYKQALQEYGVAYNNALVFKGHSSAEGGYETMLEVLKSSLLPSAICCSDSNAAVGAMQAMDEKGLKVPDDVSLIGFGEYVNMVPARFPLLTTMAGGAELMGKIAVQSLCKRLENPHKNPEKIQVPCELIIRESCREKKE